MDFDEITLKMISDRTQISRTSMYCYYKTKEEIFLDLLDREYSAWSEGLESEFVGLDRIDSDMLADIIVDTFQERPTLMRLMPIQQTIVERNASMEKLVVFKSHAMKIFDTMAVGVGKAAPNATRGEANNFLIRLLAFCSGAHPFFHPTEIQEEVVRLAGARLPEYDADALLRGGVRALAAALIG